MTLIGIDTDELEKIINKAVASAIESHELSKLPPILNKQQFMDFMDIGATKASELLNRPGFPVTREFGNPRVVTRLLLLWAEENSEWMSENAGGNWKTGRRAI